MKVQCDVCCKAHATVMCCADEAALCADCDTRVHAANKLASKHHRVPLLFPSPEDLPCCDICQDKTGFFFCLEDRALLCRNCDYSIHSMNALAAKHKRFLVTEIRVALQVITANDGLERTQVCSSSQISSPTTQISQLSSPRMAPTQKAFRTASAPSNVNKASTPIPPQPSPLYAKPTLEKGMALNAEESGIVLSSSSILKQLQQVSPTAMFLPKVVAVPPSNMASSPVNQQSHFSSGRLPADRGMRPNMVDVNSPGVNLIGVLASQRGGGGFVRRSSISEYLTETIPGWRVDELLNLPDMGANHDFADYGSSKADSSNAGDMEWHVDYNAFEDSRLGEAAAEVPSIPSPPTTSGVPRLVKPWGFGKSLKGLDLNSFLGFDDSLVVPDIGSVSSPLALPPPNSPLQKRRRTFLDF